MKNLIVRLSLIAAISVSSVTAFAQQKTQTLKDAYKDYFKVGVAINNSNLIPDLAPCIA